MYKIPQLFNINKAYFKNLLTLAFPILIGNLGHMLIGITDILVSARYNINALAAISIANAVFSSVFIFGIGILTSVSIVLSNKRGSKKPVKKFLLSTLVFSFVSAMFFTLISFVINLFIPKIGFETELAKNIQQYLSIASFSMFGMFLFEGLKQFLQSYEIVKFPNILLAFAVIINLILDIVFVFGFGIIPSMGVKGAAIATLTVRTLMGLIMFIYIFKLINFKAKTDFSYMKQLIKIGSPIGFALLLEFLAFNVITILVGRQEGLYAAVHNILTTISSVTFGIPLSISTALSVKVAYNYGANNKNEIIKYSKAGSIMGIGIMALAGIILAVFPKQIINLFTGDTEVLKIALPLIFIVAMYQIFDGFQVIMGGILKGFKMTKFVSNAVLFCYWVIAMPIALILVGKFGLLLQGYWIALATALFSMGFVEIYMVKRKLKEMKN